MGTTAMSRSCRTWWTDRTDSSDVTMVATRRKHKVVSWSVEETRQFYEVRESWALRIVSATLRHGLLYDEQSDHESHAEGCEDGTDASSLVEEQVQDRGEAQPPPRQSHAGRASQGEGECARRPPDPLRCT